MSKCSLTILLVLINILCIGLALMITQWLEREGMEVITTLAVQLFLILSIVVALSCMLLIFIGRVDLNPGQTAGHGYHRFLPYISLYVFGLGAVLLNAFEVTGTVQLQWCVDNTSNRTSEIEKFGKSNIGFMMLNIAKLIAIFSQWLFLMRFKDTRAVSRNSRTCVMFILSAYLSLYMYTFFQETKEKFHVDSPEGDSLRQYAKSKNMTKLFECLSFQQTLNNAEPYLYPFDLEFCLVVAGMLVMMLRRRAVPAQNGAEPLEGVEESSVEINLAQHQQTDDESLIEDDGRRTCMPAFNFAILFSLAVIILGLVCYDKKICKRVLPYFYSVRLVYYTLHALAAALCAVLVWRLPWRRVSFRPETVLLLVAMTGAYVYIYSGMMASSAAFYGDIVDRMIERERNGTTIQPDEYIDKPTMIVVCWLTFATYVVDIIQIACQAFILVAADGHRRLTIADPKIRAFLKELLWYLCVCNLSLWVSDSFIEEDPLKNNEAKIIVFGETAWTGIKQISYPLVLFYRFHSLHMLLDVASKINPN